MGEKWELALMLEATDAILMASGFSRRFGEDNKLLRLAGGKPLFMHTLDLVLSLPFNAVHFVAANDEVLGLAGHLPVHLHRNDHPERGQCESVRLGTLHSSADYYMFFPCDQPFLDADTVASICAKASPGKIVFPVCGGRPSAPNLFSKAFRDELLSLEDGENARVIKTRHPGALTGVPVENSRVLADVDTPEDLRELGL